MEQFRPAFGKPQVYAVEMSENSKFYIKRARIRIYKWQVLFYSWQA
jgi:hypothetical protein